MMSENKQVCENIVIIITLSLIKHCQFYFICIGALNAGQKWMLMLRNLLAVWQSIKKDKSPEFHPFSEYAVFNEITFVLMSL